MAKYNREFLVPYLTDICSLHLAKRELKYQLSDCRDDLSTCKEKIYVEEPEMQNYESPGCGTVFGILFGLFAIIVGICWFNADDVPDSGFLDFIMFAWTVFGGICLFASIKFIIDCFNEKKQAEEQYKIDQQIYRKELQEAKELQAHRQSLIPVITEEIKNREKEIKKIEGYLETAYQANIIPTRYRDIYAAIYLYDWFVSGGSDDMDMALNTYVLEEIKERLDKIIENQTTMILQQQVMLANQYKSMEQQKNHHALMEKKLDKLQTTMELSAEEQHKYHAMIESNTRAIAYFSAAQYFND